MPLFSFKKNLITPIYKCQKSNWLIAKKKIYGKQRQRYCFTFSILVQKWLEIAARKKLISGSFKPIVDGSRSRRAAASCCAMWGISQGIGSVAVAVGNSDMQQIYMYIYIFFGTSLFGGGVGGKYVMVLLSASIKRFFAFLYKGFFFRFCN